MLAVSARTSMSSTSKPCSGTPPRASRSTPTCTSCPRWPTLPLSRWSGCSQTTRGRARAHPLRSQFLEVRVVGCAKAPRVFRPYRHAVRAIRETPGGCAGRPVRGGGLPTSTIFQGLPLKMKMAAMARSRPRTDSPAITRKVLSAPRVAVERALLPLCRLFLLLLGVQRCHMMPPEVDAV